jgi:hypothetical protein
MFAAFQISEEVFKVPQKQGMHVFFIFFLLPLFILLVLIFLRYLHLFTSFYYFCNDILSRYGRVVSNGTVIAE